MAIRWPITSTALTPPCGIGPAGDLVEVVPDARDLPGANRASTSAADARAVTTALRRSGITPHRHRGRERRPHPRPPRERDAGLLPSCVARRLLVPSRHTRRVATAILAPESP